MRQMIRSAGNEPFAKITQATIVAGRDRRGTTPAQARHFLETMGGLFEWATKAKHVTANPTIGVEDPARPKGGGIPIWTEEQVAAYERRWPIGTRQRVWLDVLFIPGCAAGTRSSLAVSTFAMELRRSRRKRADLKLRSRCRSCPCSLRR
jgi:site-specific recombinase XerD